MTSDEIASPESTRWNAGNELERRGLSTCSKLQPPTVQERSEKLLFQCGFTIRNSKLSTSICEYYNI